MASSLVIVVLAAAATLSACGTSQAASTAKVMFSSCDDLNRAFPTGVAKSVKSARQAVANGFQRPEVSKKVYNKNRKKLGPVQFGSLCLQSATSGGASASGPLQVGHPFEDLSGVWGVQPFVTQSNPKGLQFHNGFDYNVKVSSAPVIATMSGRLLGAEVFIRPQDGHGQLNLMLEGPSGEVSAFSLEPSAGPADPAKVAEQVVLAQRMFDEMTVRVGDTVELGQKLTTLYAQDDSAHVHWSLKQKNGTPEVFLCPADYMSADKRQQVGELVAAWDQRLYQGSKSPDLCE